MRRWRGVLVSVFLLGVASCATEVLSPEQSTAVLAPAAFGIEDHVSIASHHCEAHWPFEENTHEELVAWNNCLIQLQSSCDGNAAQGHNEEAGIIQAWCEMELYGVPETGKLTRLELTETEPLQLLGMSPGYPESDAIANGHHCSAHIPFADDEEREAWYECLAELDCDDPVVQRFPATGTRVGYCPTSIQSRR